MKKYLIAIIAFALSFTGSVALAVTAFKSYEVGTTPVNGYYLKTNGTTSSWQPVTSGSSASTTLLTDNNTFSGINSFTNASSNWSGTWQTFSPSKFFNIADWYSTTTKANLSITKSQVSDFGSPYYTASNVIGGFTGCSGTMYLGADGACHADQTGGGGGSFPFSSDTNFGQLVYSTSTPSLWFKAGMYASSTSYFGGIVVDDNSTGTSTVQIGDVGKPGCRKERNTDNSGWTYYYSKGGRGFSSDVSCE